MYRKYVYHEITWYDFKNPHQEEFIEIAKTYDLDATVIKKFLSFGGRYETFTSGDVVYLSLYFPCALNGDSASIQKKEVRFILGKDFIITGRNSDIRGFYDTKKKIKKAGSSTNPIIKNVYDDPTTISLASLLSEIYTHIGNDLESLHASLIQAEETILHSGKITNQEIYTINKKARDYHRILEKQKDVWVAFDSICKEFFENPQSTETLQVVMRHYEETYSVSLDTKDKKIDSSVLKHRIKDKEKKVRRMKAFALWGAIVILIGVGIALM